jgi:hypothetical protein
MSYEVTLLIFGILLLLVGLIGKVKAQQLEVGTDSVAARGVIAILGALLVVFSLNPDLARSLLPASKDDQATVGIGPAEPAPSSTPESAHRERTVPPQEKSTSGAAPSTPSPAEPARKTTPPPETEARSEASPTAANDFRDLDVSEASPNELRVSIEYTYIGDMGESPPIVPSVSWNSGTNNGMVYQYVKARAEVGTGRASWTIYGDLRRPWESDEIRVCLVDTTRQKRPFCKSFPYRKRWPVAQFRPVSHSQISNFRARNVSDRELFLSVSYQYTGESGERPFRAYMSAVALQANDQQVPRTHFEGLGGPGPVRVGSGQSMMLINKYSDQAATSESVRVCINAQNDQGNTTQVLCEEFPYRKVWRCLFFLSEFCNQVGRPSYRRDTAHCITA